jgi:hypothetical protein
MAYEPRGKVATLIGAMRAAPDKPVWSAIEVAACMEIAVANVTAHLQSALSHQTLYRKLDNGKSSYSLQRFDAPAPAVSTAVPWTPPKMIPPRGTPTPTAAPERPQPAAATPVPADVSNPDPGETIEQRLKEIGQSLAELGETAAEESAEPVTWAMWEDGDLDLHGLVELEGGGHRLPAEAVQRLRKFIAWMPAC